MCSEDGTQRAVYKLKEEHAKRVNIKKNTDRRRRVKRKRKRTVEISKENNRCTNFKPLIYVRANLFNIA